MCQTLREQLVSYPVQPPAAGTSRFTVPFDRQELADYLSVDRSAMCNELSKMQKDGVIEYERNRILLKA